jgi:hypothetical protein
MKKQSRKIGVAGGFINQLMGNNATEPKVGEGATILHYSDREPYEVIEVSEDGNKCVIRTMGYKFIGQCYGDEKYEYFSDPDGYTTTLEWNEKKGCWGMVNYSIEIIKKLKNDLWKEFGFDWSDNLPNGIKYKDLIDGEPKGMYTKLKLVKGVTKEYKNFNKVSIIFGVAEKYYDPHF